MNFQRVGKVLLWCVVAVLALAVVVNGVRRMDHSDPVLIQSYEVPAEIAAEVRDTIASVVEGDNAQSQLGKVSMLPDGRLVVTAPATVHAGLKQILDAVRKAKPPATPMIAFDLWTVTATPGTPSAPSTALAEIEPALAAIVQNNGSMKFELREKVSTVTRSGQREMAEVSGWGTGLQIRASLRKGDSDQTLVAAEIKVHTFGAIRQAQGIEATAELRPDELLVIGQSALADSRQNPGTPTSQIYYILRARL